MKTSNILIFGAFGGCCPTIAKMASYYSTHPAPDIPQISTYIGLGLFAILGAFIAVGFGAKELKAAIIAGIAAPGLVTNIVNGAASANVPTPPEAFISSGFFVSAAAAQEFPVGERIAGFRGGDVLQLNTQWSGPDTSQAQVDYRFVDANGTYLPGGGTLTAGETGTVVPVPEGATQIAIADALTPLPEGESMANIAIKTAPTLGGDLLWALGAQRRYQVDDITVTFGQ